MLLTECRNAEWLSSLPDAGHWFNFEVNMEISSERLRWKLLHDYHFEGFYHAICGHREAVSNSDFLVRNYDRRSSAEEEAPCEGYGMWVQRANPEVFRAHVVPDYQGVAVRTFIPERCVWVYPEWVIHYMRELTATAINVTSDDEPNRGDSKRKQIMASNGNFFHGLLNLQSLVPREGEGRQQTT